MCCTSASDKIGGHGCAIGVHTKLPWAKCGSKPCKVNLDDVAILVSESRLLIISICTVGVECIVVSTHGPLPASKDTCVNVHWKHVCSAILACRLGRPVVLFADANAPLSLTADGCVGELVDKACNAATLDFMACLASNDVWIPSTFERYGGLVKGTRYSKIGSNLSRLNYC